MKRDVEIGGLTELALSRARFPVTLYDWLYVPALDQWQLTIASPWYDTRGPLEANSKVISALQNEGIYKDVPILRLFVRSPEDPVVKRLERELRTQTDGAVHIIKDPKVGQSDSYRVVFSPFIGPGRAIPAKTISGTEPLREFLEERLRLPKSQVDDAFTDLDRKQSTSILPVYLTRRELKAMGLA